MRAANGNYYSKRYILNYNGQHMPGPMPPVRPNAQADDAAAARNGKPGQMEIIIN